MAAGLATAMAQSNVYSLNVVGYYNVTVPQGKYYMIANQLNTTNNQIQYVMPTAQDFTGFFKYVGGGYQSTTYYGADLGGSGWDQPTFTLNPGETGFIQDPGTPGGQTLTFVGEVLQGVLSNNIPTGATCFRSSIVPQQGTPKDFLVPAEDFDTLYLYAGSGYQSTTYYGTDLGGNGWDYDPSGNGPTIAVGEGFAYLKAAGNTMNAWVRNFTVQ